MKKSCTLLVLMLFAGFAFGQVYLSEDFSDEIMPPDGWSIDNIADQWTINNTNNAGGTAPEARLGWVSGTNTTHLISPVIDLSSSSGYI